MNAMLMGKQKRMTLEDYMRNLKGVNDGSDFAMDYLVRCLVSVIWFRYSHHYSKTSMTRSGNKK